jgi:2-dehydropantoate 2-reductase
MRRGAVSLKLEPTDSPTVLARMAADRAPPLKVAVVGAGGVGGWFGGRLAKLGADKVEVTFIVRPGNHATALTRTGLRIVELDGEFTVRPLRLVNGEDLVSGAVPPESFDMVLVCVKGYHLKLVLPTIQKLLRPPGGTPTAVLPLLNGMDAPTILADALGSQHVLGGLTLILSEISSPGTVLLRKAPPMIIFGELGDAAGELAPTVSRLRSALLEAGNMSVVVPPFEDGGVRRHMWEKFVNICPFSAICASCRTSIGSIFAVPRGVALYKALLSESCAVANAHGVGRPNLFDEAWQQERHREVGRLPPEASASLSRDMLAGRPSELHDQIGALIRLAGDKGVPTTAFEVLYASLCVVESVSEQERKQRAPDDAASAAPVHLGAMRVQLGSRRGMMWLALGCAAAIVTVPALRRLRGA